MMRDSSLPPEAAAPVVAAGTFSRRAAWVWLAHGGLLICIALLLLNATLRRDRAIIDPQASAEHRIREVMIYEPAARPLLPWGGLLVLVVLAASAELEVAWLQARARCFGRMTLALGLAGVVLPLACTYVVLAGRAAAPWRVADELRTADGQNWAFLVHRSSLLGSDLCLATLATSDTLRRRYTVLGSASSNLEEPYLALVRPARPGNDRPFKIWLSADGRLLGCTRFHDCYWVFDTARRRFVAGEALRELSPFMLVGADDPLEANDQKNYLRLLDLQAARQGLGEIMNGLPARTVLEAARRHPNSAVRDLVFRSLQIYPEVRTLAEIYHSIIYSLKESQV